jgi:hypothetical protein
MSSDTRKSCTASGGMVSHLIAGLCLLMVGLVVHGTVSAGHLTGSQLFVPATDAGGGFDTVEPPDTPLFQPRGHIGSFLSEARSLGPPPSRLSDREPVSALPPVTPSSVYAKTVDLRPISWEQPRPKVGRIFGARAPPTTA